MSSTIEFLQRLGRGFKALGDGIVRTLIVWWFLLGAVFAALFLIHPGFLAADPWPKLFELLATATITGGVFETIVKSFQYSGLFKEELQGIFSSSQYKCDQTELLAEAASEIVSKTIYNSAFLEQRKDIEEVWRQVTEVLYKSRFKDISQRIANKVLQEYFPVGDNFYYDEFEENVEITFCDSEKIFIQSREKVSLTIKPIDETQKVKWGYRTDVLKRPDDTRSKVELLKLEINQKDRMTDCQPPHASKNGKSLSLEFAFELEGAKEYKVVMEMKRIYDPAVDTVRDFVAARFVNSPELHVKFPEELSLTFQPVGTRKDAYKDLSTFQNVIWNVYQDLIFPNQGYRIMFSRSE